MISTCMLFFKNFILCNRKPKILEGVYAKGYETPSVIQAKALPVILKEYAILGL